MYPLIANNVNGVARHSRYGPVNPKGVMKHVSTFPVTHDNDGGLSMNPVSA
jgi:hypothetical protein